MDQAPVWFEQSERANIYDVAGEPVVIVEIHPGLDGAPRIVLPERVPMTRAVLTWGPLLTRTQATDLVDGLRRRSVRGLLVNWRWTADRMVLLAVVAWLEPSPWISELAFPQEAPWYHPMPEPGGTTAWDHLDKA